LKLLTKIFWLARSEGNRRGQAGSAKILLTKAASKFTIYEKWAFSIMRLVRGVSITLIVLAVVLCLADSIISLLLYLGILKQMLGPWARWAGLALGPLVIALFPIYALFALEDWPSLGISPFLPILLTYGGGAVCMIFGSTGSYLLRLSERANSPGYRWWRSCTLKRKQ